MASKALNERVRERGRALFAVMEEHNVGFLEAANILDGKVILETPLQLEPIAVDREDELEVVGVRVLDNYVMPPSEVEKYNYQKETKQKKYCAFDDCENQVGWLTDSPYCKTHRNDIKKYGKPLETRPGRGNAVIRTKGGSPRLKKYNPEYRFVNNGGYVLVHHPDPEHPKFATSVLEHRLVMEQKLGRDLLPGENVHHRNGDRQDNRVSNLELWSTSQPSGQRVEDKVVWALEILELYGEYIP